MGASITGLTIALSTADIISFGWQRRDRHGVFAHLATFQAVLSHSERILQVFFQATAYEKPKKSHLWPRKQI
jgi:hypothetical protein